MKIFYLNRLEDESGVSMRSLRASRAFNYIKKRKTNHLYLVNHQDPIKTEQCLIITNQLIERIKMQLMPLQKRLEMRIMFHA